MFELSATILGKRLRTEVESGARDMETLLSGVGPSIAAALGAAIHQRVVVRQDLAGQVALPSDDDPPPKYVSPKYPDGLAGEPTGLHQKSVTRLGNKKFRTPATYYRRVGRKIGTGVTGGMMSGLSRLIATPTLTKLVFRGRSQGQAPRIRRGKAAPIKENNALKAWTLYDKRGVNPLALAESELEAIGVGCVQIAAHATGAALDVQWSEPLAPVPEVFRRALNVTSEVPDAASES